MTYEESVKYLYKIAGFAKKSSLDDINYYLQQLGNPQEGLKFVHVAGTNGKGSVCAFLEAVLQEHGKTTASFTSPHLVRVNERIRLNGKEIFDEEFADAVAKLKQCIESAQQKGMKVPSFFECLFFMALVIFQKYHPDICIIETGMGGRYDATNVITPVVSVITSISMDHMEFLGQTIEEIASHKAGIIKEGVPVVTMQQELSVSDLLREEARKKMSPIYDISEDNLKFNEKAAKYVDFLNANAYDKRRDVRTNIAGTFQNANLAMALKTAQIICQHMDADKICNALTKIKIPGRMEEIAPGIIVDVSHNIQGMQGFVETVEDNFPDKKKRILFAASHKNEEEYMKNILKEISKIEAFYTVAINNRRINEEEFQDVFRRMIDQREKDTVCFVVGSFYLAGMAKDFMDQEEKDVKF
jgi:dihydrofolate synthase/folylpolyglutamate synthase